MGEKGGNGWAKLDRLSVVADTMDEKTPERAEGDSIFEANQWYESTRGYHGMRALPSAGATSQADESHRLGKG